MEKEEEEEEDSQMNPVAREDEMRPASSSHTQRLTRLSLEHCVNQAHSRREREREYELFSFLSDLNSG